METVYDINKQINMTDRHEIIKKTLAIFLPVFILITAVTAVILMISESAEMTEYQKDEWRIVDVQVANINDDLLRISSDLMFLVHRKEMTNLWDDGGIPVPEVLADLTVEYLTASTYWGLYDQIRLIDENGMEIARVNFNNGLPVVVPQEELQNKKGRYYFDDAFKLVQGEVFVSPLDLNIEHGEIEQPLKPMIRFATPVFDQHRTKRGIVLLNYFGSKLIERFSGQVVPSNGIQSMLLNADGYWLVGPNPEDEWGFMYKERKDRVFQNTYPEAWEKIKSDESGQIETSLGLFTFKTVYPLLEGQKSSKGSGEAFAPSMMQLEAKEYHWKIVSFVPVDILYANRNNRRMNAALIVTFLSVAVFFGMWRVVQEITVRRQIETMVRESEKMLRVVFNTTTDEFILFDPDGIIVAINKSATKAWNLTPEQLVGKNAFDFLPSEVRKRRRKHFNEIVADKKPLRLEDKNQGKHYDNSVFPILDDDGNLQFVALFAQDVTERKQATEALQEREAQLRQIIDLVPHFIFVKDETGKFEIVNKATAKVYGTTVEDLTGRREAEFVASDEEMEHFRADDLEVINSGKTKFISKEPITDSENNIRYLQTTKVPFRSLDSEKAALLGVAVDITERVKAEAALAEKSIYLDSILRSATEYALATTDLDFRITYYNPLAEQFFGYTAAEVIGKTVQEMHTQERVAPERFENAVENVRVHGEYRYQFIQERDGEKRYLNSRVSGIYDRTDELVGFALFSHDITERKQMEEQLRHQDRLAAIGQLAGGIAHDFNNILVPIIGYVELGMMKLSPDSKLYADLNYVRKAADRAVDLTRQILAFSRKQVLEMKTLDLNEVIAGFEKMLRRVLREDITLQIALEPSLHPVRADQGQLEQVLMNLAVNAGDAMPEGGKLIIETDHIILDEKYAKKHVELQPGPYMMLTISDTGHGMDTETRQHIFEPFFTTKERGQGTGLGLATVFGIVKQHNGHIWVYSKPDQGATFKIYLPQAEDTIQIADPVTVEPSLIYGTETVLVVEDEEMVRKLACETLQAHGFNVIEAKNPDDSLQLVANYKAPIHLLLTDVIMPEMNGYELYQRLTIIHPDIRVLYMSGYTDNVITHHGILDEGVSFLQKPFTIHSLTRKVRTVLS